VWVGNTSCFSEAANHSTVDEAEYRNYTEGNGNNLAAGQKEKA
jgi:hypothetical protein